MGDQNNQSTDPMQPNTMPGSQPMPEPTQAPDMGGASNPAPTAPTQDPTGVPAAPVDPMAPVTPAEPTSPAPVVPGTDMPGNDTNGGTPPATGTGM